MSHIDLETENRELRARLADAQARLDAVKALADEHERTCDPAPYTSERALIERLRHAIDGGDDDA